jgi:hypothetical protein
MGQTETGSAACTLLSDGWHTTALPANVTGVSFGPLGIGAVSVSASGDPGSWQVLFSRDGVNWSSASLVSLSRGAVDGANVVVGANRVVVTISRPPNGQPAARSRRPGAIGGHASQLADALYGAVQVVA